MKKLIPLILLFLTSLLLQAQQPLQKAPLNPDFKQYIDDLKKSRKAGDSMLGYVPPPYRVHFGNYQSVPRTKSGQQLPSRYDLREEGHVTPVKDQGQFGTCWAFSSIGAIESRWKRLEDEVVDLSEKNMVTCNGYAYGPDDGGNIYMASAYLTRLQGPLPEEDDPYGNLTDTSTCWTYGDPPAYIPEVRFLPKDQDEVKRAIMNYGAISTSMYVDENGNYYNPSDFTWYYNGNEISNHGILIVGWDDNKLVTGGTEIPDTRGAWIIKNSWGTNFGEAGYFYLAYDDTEVLTSNGFYPFKENVENIDSLHHYDRLGMVSSLGNGRETIYGITRFELQEGESLQKIGTFVSSYGAEVGISIYGGFDYQAGEPTDLLTSLPNRQVIYPGYHTFDLASEATGEIYVKVRYHTPDYGYPLPVELAIDGYSNPAIQTSGTNWYSHNGQDWFAMGSDTEQSPYDLTIRAYTKKSTPVAAFESERTYYCLGESITFRDRSSGDIDTYKWDFGSAADPQQANGAGPHQVNYSSSGTKTIRLEVEGPEGQDSTIKRDYVVVSQDLHIFFGDSIRKAPLGDTVDLQVKGHAETYEWSGEGLVSSSSNTARVTIDGNQQKTTSIAVTGHTSSCFDSDSIKVRFTLGPENNDVCNAIALEPGLTENLTNRDATVQANEPIPDTTGPNACTEPMKWCAEGGLQHTVWFKFEVSREGKTSVITSGMDTQIAIYEAAGCEDILIEDQHTLLAANDDYFDLEDDFAAAIMDYEGLIPGQTYWLQLDGSARGVMGTFSIRLNGTAVGTEDIESLQDQVVEIFPNPSDGFISLRFLQSIEQPAQIEIFTLEGQKIGSQRLHNTRAGSTEQMHIPANQSGMYILQLTHPSNTLIRRILIR